MIDLGGFPESDRFMSVLPFTSLVLWHGIDSPFLSPLVVVCL